MLLFYFADARHYSRRSRHDAGATMADIASSAVLIARYATRRCYATRRPLLRWIRSIDLR